jgi:hypothetical protein
MSAIAEGVPEIRSAIMHSIKDKKRGGNQPPLYTSFIT